MEIRVFCSAWIFDFFNYIQFVMITVIFSAKSMAAKGSKGDSSNDPKASTDSSTTLEDDDPKGM